MNGATSIHQEATGYRYNRDSILLADFFSSDGVLRLLDVGAGVGVVSLLIARNQPEINAVALELQPALAHMAACNSTHLPPERYFVVIGDLRLADRFFRPILFDAIVCNPPYYRKGEGRICPDASKAMARHELTMTLDDLVSKSAKLLRPGGSLSVSMIAERRAEYLCTLDRYGMGETRVKMVRADSSLAPFLFLSEARVGGAGAATIFEPLLTLRRAEGGDSEAFNVIADRFR